MKTLIESVSLLTGLSKTQVQILANKAPHTYRKYRIPKKRGGQRPISHPSKETKLLQYAATDILISGLPVHCAAMGFIPGLRSPLRENALRHAHNAYMLRVDFEEFFPSIRPADFFTVLDSAIPTLGIAITEGDREFLKKVLFVKYAGDTIGLPIGAPTSPLVSNVVMHPLDKAIQTLAEHHDAVYTRYADDLIFSTSVQSASSRLLSELVALLEATSHPSVSLNNSKTCYMSRNCRRAVTGLIITPEGDISIGRKNKRMLKALLCQSQHETISDSNTAYLQGYLAFLLDVEPTYYNRLVLKYGADVVSNALMRRIPAESE